MIEFTPRFARTASPTGPARLGWLGRLASAPAAKWLLLAGLAAGLAWLAPANELRAAADDPPAQIAAVPVPDAAAQTKAEQIVKELFGKAISAAKTPAAKLDLAKNFLQKGIDSQGDPGGQYVLLRMARDEAIAALDAGTTVEAIDEMARSFQIDGLAAKFDALTTISKSPLTLAQGKAFVESTTALADDAVAADRFEIAKQVLGLGLAAAKKSRDPDLIKQLNAWAKETDTLAAAYHDVEAAQAKLEEKPLDPNANLAVGRYRALVKEDWDHGIPMLALGSDPKLKDLAIQELNTPETGDEMLKLADGWWDDSLTLEASLKDHAEGRAVTWYTAALPQLMGLDKLRVVQRLQTVNGKVFARIRGALRTKKVALSRSVGPIRGPGGFIDVLDEGGLLIGFQIGTIDVNGQRYIRSLRPVYRSARGDVVYGSNHGSRRGNVVTIKAKEGYAVGGLVVRGSKHIEGLAITFMQTEGLALSPRNSYSSDWFGSQGPGVEIHLGGSGALVVGFAGRATNVIDAISLITCDESRGLGCAMLARELTSR